MAQGGTISASIPMASPQAGAGAPTVLTAPPRGDTDLYIDTIPSKGNLNVWAYEASVGHWYPTNCCLKAAPQSDGVSISEAVNFLLKIHSIGPINTESLNTGALN